MNCNRCGNPIDPNSNFCNTCGNAINQPTVVPQVNNTVVPQVDNTVVPTVVPQKNNTAPLIAIILVLIVFIGAGCAGVILLKQTKSTVGGNVTTQNIVYNDPATKAITTTSKQAGWNTTTQQTRIDVIDENSYYKVNGLNITVPAGYTSTYSNDVLTVVDPNKSKFYMINVVDRRLETLDLNEYRNYLAQNGYSVDEFVKTKIGSYDVIAFNMPTENGVYNSFLVRANSTKTAIFMFVNESDADYIYRIIDTSLRN